MQQSNGIIMKNESQRDVVGAVNADQEDCQSAVIFYVLWYNTIGWLVKFTYMCYSLKKYLNYLLNEGHHVFLPCAARSFVTRTYGPPHYSIRNAVTP